MYKDVNLYQIVYSEASHAGVDTDFPILDNRDNARPDWYEYWPIRRFFLEQETKKDSFYGFFSPRFTEKTSLSLHDVAKFVSERHRDIDIALFCPQPDMGAFFLNVFEQGEVFDPGFIEAASDFFSSIGTNLPLANIVMDSRHIVFSNYFAAKPAFWNRWLEITEALFGICEGEPSPLKDKLTAETSYKGIQRKVFLMERIASLLLRTERQWRVAAANPFGFGWSMSRFREHPSEAIISDALKIAFNEQGFGEYIETFSRIRRIFQDGTPSPVPKPGK